eukprot:TRINITY_DN3189_c0_g1_i1.p4 TRINITY_DN3189_c0_g1~~TRINITY_DN3189_c0_g1_i1.p4  ORF type:complete len:116 (-),score=35.38 TRINITY_DN3189_c0_g1_i1:1274-1621(-)
MGGTRRAMHRCVLAIALALLVLCGLVVSSGASKEAAEGDVVVFVKPHDLGIGCPKECGTSRECPCGGLREAQEEVERMLSGGSGISDEARVFVVLMGGSYAGVLSSFTFHPRAFL